MTYLSHIYAVGAGNVVPGIGYARVYRTYAVDVTNTERSEPIS